MVNLIKQLFCFVALCVLCYAVNAVADDTAKQTTKEQTTNTEKKKNNRTPNIGKRGQVKPLEEFIPSEEVSADKPVAFPNDI